jgi:hypothetical protein
MTKTIMILVFIPSLLAACGGQIGGGDPQDWNPLVNPSQPAVTADPDCADLDAYWQALEDSGCVATGPGSSAAETAKEGHSCADSAAALDACYADASCRGPHSLTLLQTCTGLVPWWPGLRGTE